MAIIRVHLPCFSMFITLWRNVKFGWHLTLHFIRRTTWHYGITSRVYGEKNQHWLLFDFDVKNNKPYEWLIKTFPNVNFIYYSTEHGSHAVVYKKASLRETCKILVSCPYVDLKWLGIGLKRGYWFLHTRPIVKQFEHMKVRY